MFLEFNWTCGWAGCSYTSELDAVQLDPPWRGSNWREGFVNMEDPCPSDNFQGHDEVILFTHAPVTLTLQRKMEGGILYAPKTGAPNEAVTGTAWYPWKPLPQEDPIRHMWDSGRGTLRPW